MIGDFEFALLLGGLLLIAAGILDIFDQEPEDRESEVDGD